MDACAVLTDYISPAFEWVCTMRSERGPQNEFWGFRRKWTTQQCGLERALRAGRYQLSPQRRVRKADGESVDIWCARDALVLKALALYLAQSLPAHITCTHVKGHGGLKGAVRGVARHLPSSSHVFRTDVKSYYASIDHIALLDRLAPYVTDRRWLNLIGQYLKRSTEYGGTFKDFHRGISPGCPLSPLMGAFYLHELDVAMAAQPIYYVRYMDDIIVLAASRHKLRRAIAVVNQNFAALGLKQHPDKTSIGHAARGFEFLGYHFDKDRAGACRLSLAAKTIANHQAKLAALMAPQRRSGSWTSSPLTRSRLYERDQDLWRPAPKRPIGDAITDYTKRWIAWAKGGLKDVNFTLDYTRELYCRA